MTGEASKPAAAVTASESKTRQRWRQRFNRWRWHFSISRGMLDLTLVATAWSIFAFGGVYTWAYTIAYFLLDLGVLFWAVQWLRGRVRLRPDPLLIPVLALLVWVAAQWLWVSPIPGRTLTSLLHVYAAAAVYFLVSQNFQAREDSHWLGRRLAWLCGGLAWLGLVEWASGSHGIYWHFHYLLAKPFGPFVNADNFAACMTALLPISALQVWHARHRPDYALLWSAIPIVGMADIILSRSLSGLLTLGVELVCMSFLFSIWRKREMKPAQGQERRSSKSGPEFRRRAARPWRLAGLGLLLLIILLRLTGLGPQALRLGHLQTDVSTRQRLDLARSTLALWQQRPWTGWGLNTWQPMYYHYAHLNTVAVFEYAHNDWLQWLAETGIIGSVIALLGLGWLAWTVRQKIRSPDRIGEKLSWAATMGVGAVMLSSLAQFNMHLPAIMMVTSLLVGIMAAPVTSRRPGGGSH